MKVEQISIFLENKSGRLAEVTKMLSQVDVNIRALSLADTSDFGVLRLIVNDNLKAKEALKNNGFTVGQTEVVAVEVPDKPGGLNFILEILYKEQINIEYMYTCVRQNQDNAIMIFRFEDTNNAIKALINNNIQIVTGEKLYSL